MVLRVITGVAGMSDTAVLALLTLRLFYGDYRFLVFNWIMNLFFLAFVGIEIALGLESPGEIMFDILIALVFVLYSIGFIFTYFFYIKDKRAGRLKFRFHHLKAR